MRSQDTFRSTTNFRFLRTAASRHPSFVRDGSPCDVPPGTVTTKLLLYKFVLSLGLSLLFLPPVLQIATTQEYSLTLPPGVYDRSNVGGGHPTNKRALRFRNLCPVAVSPKIICLAALTQTEPVLGDLKEATSGSTRYKEATIYITAWQALAGVAKVNARKQATYTSSITHGRLTRLMALRG